MTVIAPFGWWHIPAATAIEVELFEIQPWSEAQFWSELAADDRMLFAALVDDELAGYADLRIAADEAEILNIAVQTSRQKQGIGTSLLMSMMAAARDAQVSKLLLEVRVGNDDAIALYERNGFRTVGQRPNYYALGVHALLMERHV